RRYPGRACRSRPVNGRLSLPLHPMPIPAGFTTELPLEGTPISGAPSAGIQPFVYPTESAQQVIAKMLQKSRLQAMAKAEEAAAEARSKLYPIGPNLVSGTGGVVYAGTPTEKPDDLDKYLANEAKIKGRPLTPAESRASIERFKTLGPIAQIGVQAALTRGSN